MSKMTMPEPVTVPIDKIKPYWRNPRNITDEAVNALAESIRQFGYQQPIVVDEDFVIIVGHTRYAAMRRLGVTEVPVIVTDLDDDKVREYRLIDNRSGEFSIWDFEALATEIADLDSDLIKALFTDVSGVIETEGKITEEYGEGWEDPGDRAEEVEFVCPTCFHSWEMKVSEADLIGGRLEIVKEEKP